LLCHVMPSLPSHNSPIALTTAVSANGVFSKWIIIVRG
jgi:hypothetical protein